jgi:hypothetical protein
MPKWTENAQVILTVGTLIVGLSFWVGSSAMQILHLDKEIEKQKQSLEEFRSERLSSDRISNDRVTSMQIEIAKLNSNLEVVIRKWAEKLDR